MVAKNYERLVIPKIVRSLIISDKTFNNYCGFLNRQRNQLFRFMLFSYSVHCNKCQLSLKRLTVPRKHPIIHGDRKSMHYSTNFVCVCGRCTLIHAPAPGSTLKHELQKHLVKVGLLGEPCRRAFLEIDITRSAACFASRTFQLTTTNMTWY